MAKKDENGRIVIPQDVMSGCAFFSHYELFENGKFVFFINTQGEIGVSIILKHAPLPNDFKFLGNCDYDSASHTINMPENVDIALGSGEDYFFATSIEGRAYLYIYKNKTDAQKLSAILSNVQETLKGLEAYLDESLDD
ncbi:MAG: hypothetical protein HFJ41_05750 [Clostridia bacterium]|nr:hypothetical protein [Clostridia bacterium]